MKRSLHVDRGLVCRLPGERFGYLGWPTVARLADAGVMTAAFKGEYRSWIAES